MITEQGRIQETVFWLLHKERSKNGVGTELSKDQVMEELIALLIKNQQKEDANHIYEMASKREEKEELMEYSIKLNAVNNPDKKVRAFATVVFGESVKVTNVPQCLGAATWSDLGTSC